ncbi:hypothetical protein N7510_009457 [Penicillium lagena]|uniref:uncharacterized protein n=1 Tax=Penicillium lagena TaxID=94218 RepID=UPI0025425FE8|nr:uncharacterized protein N7510_009457 [Penicillium lagena]KAJ5606676.1 hypothetical protein N7510_009457 [Penicillium lagena]
MTAPVPTTRPGIHDNGSTQSSWLHEFPHHLLPPTHPGTTSANPLHCQHQQREVAGFADRDIHHNGVPPADSRHTMNTRAGPTSTPLDVTRRAAAMNAAGQSSEYFGESSTFDFMTKVCSPAKDISREPTTVATQAATSLATSSLLTPFFEGMALGMGNDDIFSLPNRFIADQLVDAYFKFSHSLNTYLHEGSFRQRYERLWLHGGVETTEKNLAWFALVNLVFTFGSHHAPVINRVSIDDSHFFRRAKILVFSSLFQPGTIDIVQSLLLMGQYLHSSLELEYSWTVIGLANRLAQGLGLHLNADNFTSNVIEKEIRKRVWWGCFVIDRILSMKLGRPPTIYDGSDITVGLPLAIDDEYLENSTEGPPTQPPQTPSKLEFLTQVIVQVRLLERICKRLYNRGLVDFSEQKLTDIPKLLAISIELDGDLTAWQQSLPPHLQPDGDVPGWHFERQRSTLFMR